MKSSSLRPSPFMLLVAKIREEFHEVLPAITHEDGTGHVKLVLQRLTPSSTICVSK